MKDSSVTTFCEVGSSSSSANFKRTKVDLKRAEEHVAEKMVRYFGELLFLMKLALLNNP